MSEETLAQEVVELDAKKMKPQLEGIVFSESLRAAVFLEKYVPVSKKPVYVVRVCNSLSPISACSYLGENERLARKNYADILSNLRDGNYSIKCDVNLDSPAIGDKRLGSH